MLQQQLLGPGDPGVIGAYRLVERLGEGGQGVVYLALTPAGERVVVKLLRLAAPRDRRARVRLAREVSAARSVARFCIAQVLDADLDGDPPYVVSEYVEGPTLADLVRSSGPVSGAALDRLAIGTATALAAIHQARIVHRDVKPGNVVLGPDGPRVIDFGIAHDLADDATATAAMVGTPAYTAPEQVTSGAVGPPADLFAWGSTMTFAATGHSPFDAGTPVAALHRVMHSPPDLAGVPGPLAAVVRRCLEKDPALRPTAEQVLLGLLGGAQDGTTGTDLGTGPTGPTGPAPAPALAPVPDLAPAEDTIDDRDDGAARRRPPPLVVAVVLLAGLAGGGVWRVAASSHGGSAAPVAVSRSTASSTGSGTPAQAGALVVPAGFRGTWTGQVAQPPGSRHRFPVSLALPGGAVGGTLTLPSLGCEALVDVTVPPPSDRRLALAERITADPRGSCAPRARILLAPGADGTLAFFWQDAVDPRNTATAVLSRG